MENLSPIALPVTIDIHPYLRDHRFDGRAVFPAVEAMQILAGAAEPRIQGAPGRRISDAEFDKFLVVSDHAEKIEATVDLAREAGQRIQARLKTRIRAGKSPMTRIKTHARLRVSTLADQGPEPLPADEKSRMEDGAFLVDPQRLYRDLVPFGPAYRNICRPLCLSEKGALARILAPHWPAQEAPLGAPFVLDAAFHAACVWGQRYANVVAFPVALKERSVWIPTRAGESYTALVLPSAVDSGRLVFDIWISGPDRCICETVFGVGMRDVSGGRWKPPAWIGEGNR